MGVAIRLQKAGNRNRPFYRVVVTDSRKPRDGAFLDRVGHYNPIPDPDEIVLDRGLIDEWITKGAKPTDAVRALIKRVDRRAKADPTAETAAAAKETADKAVAETEEGK